MCTRLKSLRNIMSSRNLNAIIIPTNDAHFSEYTAAIDNRRQFISNFSGSAGTAIVTDKKACLWTDGRYFVQANKQLNFDEWTLMKMGEIETPSEEQFLTLELNENETVYVDGSLMPIKAFLKLQKRLNYSGINLVCSGENPVDAAWLSEGTRPLRTNNPLISLDDKFSGQSYSEKLKNLRKKMEKVNVEFMIFSSLDDIAWLTNLRGSDITCNPVFFSYCLLSKNKLFLYLQNPSDPILETHFGSDLKSSTVELLPYETATKDILNKVSISKTWITEELNFAIAGPLKNKIETTISEVCLLKAHKNATEIKAMKSANVKAAVAISKYLSWLENNFEKSEISESDASEKLTEFYSQGEFYVSQSFDSISSTNENGNILHYKPIKGQDKIIEKGMYLVDSGAQYLDGTTDTTRTVWLGSQAGDRFSYAKECYTRVLKGHISIANCKFPIGTTGYQIDCLARKSLWDVGLDYLHGTGHGIGSFLNVHEGPRTNYISSKAAKLNLDNDDSLAGHASELYLKPGYIVSNEPGYYEENAKFGIRLENAIIVVDQSSNDGNNDDNDDDGNTSSPKPKRLKYQGNFSKKFLGFENLIFCPYDQRLIEADLLTAEEKTWLNDYNSRCREILFDRFSDSEAEVRRWVEKNTESY